VKFNDDVGRPRGEFILNVFRGGELIEQYRDANLVVDSSKPTLAKLLGGTVANNSVTQIAFGTSGTSPAPGNTSITSPYQKAIDTVTYPASNQVSFNFSLGTGEANGMGILEFGLLTTAGALFARKVRTSALNKDTDLTLSGSWIISF
jgi:hypothetical protein